MEDYKIKEEIWIEKYRPFRLDQVAGQEEIIERLKSYVATKNFLISSFPDLRVSEKLLLQFRLLGKFMGKIAGVKILTN